MAAREATPPPGGWGGAAGGRVSGRRSPSAPSARRVPRPALISDSECCSRSWKELARREARKMPRGPQAAGSPAVWMRIFSARLELYGRGGGGRKGHQAKCGPGLEEWTGYALLGAHPPHFFLFYKLPGMRELGLVQKSSFLDVRLTWLLYHKP